MAFRRGALQCGGGQGNGEAKKNRAVGAFFPQITNEGHFQMEQETEWLAYLDEHGWVVVEFKVENDHTEGATRRLREALTAMKKNPDDLPPNQRNPLYRIDEEQDLPPLKGVGLRQYYGLPQTPFADHLRLAARPVFATVHGVRESELTCSLDAPALSINAKKYPNWLHVDKHPDTPTRQRGDAHYCIQGTICVHTTGTERWARVGQHVCWMKLVDRLPDARAKFEAIRKSSAVSTHIATIGYQKLDFSAIPKFPETQAQPKEWLQVVYPPEEDRMFNVLVPPASAPAPSVGPAGEW